MFHWGHALLSMWILVNLVRACESYHVCGEERRGEERRGVWRGVERRGAERRWVGR